MEAPQQPASSPEAVIEEIYRAYAPDVLRFSLYLCGNYALAQDLTSETFVRVWTASAAVRVASAKAYLFTMARNLYLDRVRRERAHRSVMLDECEGAAGPAAGYEQREELAQTLRDLALLAEGDRAALVLSVFEQLSHAEVAAALGIQVNAVKARVFRARLRLAELRAGRAAASPSQYQAKEQER